MNTKGYLLVLLVLVVVGAGAWFALRGPSERDMAEVEATAAMLAEKPIIQLSDGGYAIFTAFGESQPITLSSGDGLNVPGLLELDETSTAVIYFSDGSEARVTHGARLEITEASYEAVSGTSRVSFVLEAGRVWSKIVELATPDSKWEVVTPTAVATVRGTAFDVEVDGEASTFFTASNSVAVALRDLEKRDTLLASEAVMVEAGAILKIDPEAVAQVRADTTIVLATQAASDEYRADLWVRDNADVDAALDTELTKLREEGKAGEDLRGRLRTRAATQLRGALPLEHHRTPVERTPAPVDAAPATETPTVETRTENLPTRTDASIQTSAPTKTSIQTETRSVTEAETKPTIDQKPAVSSIGLDVVSRTTLQDVAERTQIPLRAVLRLSNGETREVTNEAKWQVVGLIGSVTSAGVFTAKLDPSVAEFGESSGSIVVTWKDPQSGASFLGKTPIFKVLFATRGDQGEPI